MRSLLQLLARFAFPVLILIAAFAFVFFSTALPPSLGALEAYGPYIVFAAGAAFAVAFNRGRALFALITLVAAYAARQSWLEGGLTTPEARAVYLAITVFVPLNLALFAVLPERGTFNRHGALRLALIAVQVILTAAVIASGRTEITEWAAQKFLDPAPFGIGRIPQAAIVAVVLGLIASMAAAVISRSAISAACAGAIVAFAVAAHVPTASLTFSIFTAAGELMVAIAILLDRFAPRSTASSRKGPQRGKT
jgi:hypothetical protein